MGRRVSIPFIAGQWSLPQREIAARAEAEEFQSPSLRGSGRFRRMAGVGRGAGACFNPLHCGAVVASECPPRRTAGGQGGFNPLHCGAVVASWVAEAFDAEADLFQSPSLRGSGRFDAHAEPRGV